MLKRLVFGFFGLLLVFSLLGCEKAAYYTNTGYFNMYRGAPMEAQQDFTKALLENPGYVVARYNLAMSDLHLEQLKNSLKELDALEALYEKSLTSEQQLNSKTLYTVYFAKAFLLGLIQNVPEALATYQKALRLKPDSIDVKNNIELLTAKGKGGSGGESGEKQKGDEGESGEDKSDGEGDENKNKDGKGDDKKTPPKGQDDSSLKKKNLSKEEIEQILKEIKDQESKVRSKENKGKVKKGSAGEKTW